jgi:hypothetical protein
MLRNQRIPFMLLLLLLALTLACGGKDDFPRPTPWPSTTFTMLPPTDTAVPPADTAVPPTDTSVPPTDTPLPPTETIIPLPPTPTLELAFVFVRISPRDGSLSTQLAAEVQKAYALGYTPVVEFDASW